MDEFTDFAWFSRRHALKAFFAGNDCKSVSFDMMAIGSTLYVEACTYYNMPSLPDSQRWYLYPVSLANADERTKLTCFGH